MVLRPADLSTKDLSGWKNRGNDDERHFIFHVLASFTASNGIVDGSCTRLVSFSTLRPLILNLVSLF
jgi:hypothetical protein